MAVRAAVEQLPFAPGLPKTLRKIGENQTDQIGDTTTLAAPSAVTALVKGKQ